MATKPQRPRGVWKRQTDALQLERLQRKGLTYRIPVLKPKAWRALTSADPTIPRSYGQLRAMSRRLFSSEERARLRHETRWSYLPRRGVLIPVVEECGESPYAAFFAGLSNPYLTGRQRAVLEATMDADTPGFENQHETEHFVLNWTNSSSNPLDNISDPDIVIETGDFLETAWDRYVDGFGRTPYVPSGTSKIEVAFEDISGLGLASPPDGPIKFDAAEWVSDPGIRRPTSAHELFHKLQYAFGYRTTHTPISSYKWFSEGTASWAEVFVWQRVSGSYKLLDLFTAPDTHLFDASYRALPFWVFFESRQRSDANDNPVLNFLTKYEAHGDEELALEEAVADEWAPNNVYASLPNLFALFSRERQIGAWKTGPTGAVYQDIIGPDGATIEPTLTTVEVPLFSALVYVNVDTVTAMGSDYYRFLLQPGTHGETLSIAVDGAAAGDFSYYLVMNKNGSFQRAIFPFMADNDYSYTDTISLAEADEIVFIVSGRGTGGGYKITVTVS